MPCFFPPNHSVTKIMTEPKIDLMLQAALVNGFNRLYAEESLAQYRANSQMHLSNCLIKVINSDGRVGTGSYNSTDFGIEIFKEGMEE